MLFLIFINDIVKLSSQLNFNLFADDTSIYVSVCNELNLYNVMSAELVKVCSWMLANKLELNIDKTIYISPILRPKTVTNTNQMYMFNSAIYRKN